MGGSGGALAELWEAVAELRQALGELWEGLYIEKLPINRTSGRYVNQEGGYEWGCRFPSSGNVGSALPTRKRNV